VEGGHYEFVDGDYSRMAFLAVVDVDEVQVVGARLEEVQ
jgi:hypothetical protein